MSGAQIGGVVGAIAGSFIPGVGTQIGYAIGSAIGGYIDPTQIKGPRITDAAQQTSSVGVPLPFGYGTFSTAGNVIWADELKEHVKRQRQGKGGGAKTTTYTYTRSYAIGVCEGPIYGYLIVKRNGKVVYNSDPNAPVADKDYSAKWLQRATLYYGNETQMPDSTIEAVEGAGNVSAFRGLAYIVIENEDLTDLAGAVPQYEFIVQATLPDVYVTSVPYPAYASSSSGISLIPESGILRSVLDRSESKDYCGLSFAAASGELSDKFIPIDAHSDSAISSIPHHGHLRDHLKRCSSVDESSVSISAESGSLKAVVIRSRDTVESCGITYSPTHGILS